MENMTAVITQESAKISCNFEDVEAAIREALAEYKGAVFTEDSKAYAKKHVARLRAQKKAFQDNLRENKKEYMRPWDEFEGRAKQLIAMYDEPIDLINGQVQAFEEKRITQKKQDIRAIYEGLVSMELREFIPLERIYNSKWENATFKEKDVRSEIFGTVDKVRKDIATINSMNSDAVGKALSKYQTGLDLTEAVSYINSYERQKQEIIARDQERARREEAERVRQEEREKILAEQRGKEEKEAALKQAELEKQEALRKAEEEKAEALRLAEEEKADTVEQAKKEAAQEIINSLIPESDDDTELYEYRISLSSDAKEKLELYMDSVGIEWEMM